MKMTRVLQWSAVPALLMALTITGCGGRSATTAAEGAVATATNEAPPSRTIVLHVTGMMKSKSGAT